MFSANVLEACHHRIRYDFDIAFRGRTEQEAVDAQIEFVDATGLVFSYGIKNVSPPRGFTRGLRGAGADRAVISDKTRNVL